MSGRLSPDELATEIRQLRRWFKMTQREFSRELGVSQQKLSDWEHGRRLRAVLEAMRIASLLHRRYKA